jgi:hypothetical protein
MIRFHLADDLVFTLNMKLKEKYTEFIHCDTNLTPNLTSLLIFYRCYKERDSASHACPVDEPGIFHKVGSFVMRQSKFATKLGKCFTVGNNSSKWFPIPKVE